MEDEQAQIHTQLANPRLYQEAGGKVAQLKARLEALEAELSAGYARWEELESI